LHLGVDADDAAEEGALVELFEDGGEEEFADSLADGGDLCAGEEVGDEFAILEDEVVEAAAGAGGGELVALEGGEDGAEDLGVDEVVEDGGVAFFAEPVEDVGAEGMIADGAVDFLFQIEMAFLVLEEAGDLGNDAAGAAEEEADGF